MESEITIGRRGSITLPAKIRKRFGLQQNDRLVIEETEQGLLLRPTISVPLELYTEERISDFQEDDRVVGQMIDDLVASPDFA
ncbi:MAG: AbrB/MazE/SpoVT family DNA-binding domain-containing protein [Opitutales bacterium]|nr:AbrB/MazE/SpoVT family DNA-binding domain-containing protein [Opitutales bacterium]NRA28453.1 AbrB/MazE/SpoVT family DNA-binding domain-containing protein [Opitutales bacterium]